jgi:hypothetical protein
MTDDESDDANAVWILKISGVVFFGSVAALAAVLYFT